MNATNVRIVRRVDREGNVEPFDIMLKRFKKAYQESGILADLRKHEFAMSKGQKKAEKRKRAAEVRRRDEARANRYVIREV